MFLLRAIQPDDLKQVLSLAKLLAAVNLSGQPEELQKQIQKSMAAFSGKTRNKGEADYIFCLEDLDSKRIIGTSMIMAQHGTKDVPHFYFQVFAILFFPFHCFLPYIFILKVHYSKFQAL